MALKLKGHFRAWRYRIKLDPDEIRFVRRSIKEGDSVLDVGAHKGAYTYWMQKTCGPKGICYAFEPQPVLFQKLVQSYSNQANVNCQQKGLSEHPGSFQLFVPDATDENQASPGATLEPRTGLGHFHTVVTTSIDHFFSDRDHPTFIKIDVEGHELAVLKGARNVLTTSKPTLLMECEVRHLQHHITDVFLYLEQLGYKGFFFLKGKREALTHFDPREHQKTGEGRFWTELGYVNNFVFLSE